MTYFFITHSLERELAQTHKDKAFFKRHKDRTPMRERVLWRSTRLPRTRAVRRRLAVMVKARKTPGYRLFINWKENPPALIKMGGKR